MSSANDKIIEIYLLKAKLTLVSPLMIASGVSDEADKEVALYYQDRNTKRAYIPASSFAGALLHQVAEINGKLSTDDKIKIDDILLEYITGSIDEYQSHFVPEDVISFDAPKITTRDGVAINNDTGTAEAGAKYDYQIIEPGIDFHFKAMIKVREGMKDKEMDAFIHHVNYLLVHDDQFAFGANTNNGFGLFKCEGLDVAHFSFPKDKETYFRYLSGLNVFGSRDEKYYQHFPASKLSHFEDADYVCERDQFMGVINFTMKTNTIIGSNQDKDTDKSTLLSDGTPVLSGKSIRGSVLAMMEQILHYSDLKIDKQSLWGHEKKGDNNYKNSRLKIEEVRLKDDTARKYTRNRIDRFTGGTIDGALFDSKPIQAGQAFDIVFRIHEPTLDEITLLVHTIRELWVGRLTLGGEKAVGRGVLEGNSGTITYKSKSIKFDNIDKLREQWSDLKLI